MGKKQFIILILLIIMSLTACISMDKKTDVTISDNKPDATTVEIVVATSENIQQITEKSETSETSIENDVNENTPEDYTDKEVQLLHSASVDLDNDGDNEGIEVLQIKEKAKPDAESGELEGTLKIFDKGKIIRIPFIKKQAGMSGVLTSIEFADLDGDGAKDIFIIIPEFGASFSLNYFYIYSYKKDKSFSFSSDTSLSEFAKNFYFKYKGKGKLEVFNESLGFKSIINIEDDSSFESEDANNTSYENSWVEPIPIEISEDSRILLSKSNDGSYEIKVPLPVFGLATVDMIGEIDLFYKIDKDFSPVLNHFIVYDLKNAGKDLIGRWNFN